MVIDRKTLRMAMLRVCRAVHGREGEALHEEDLVWEWRRTGLRASDLTAALREMIQRRLLVTVDNGPFRDYRLTEAGLRELRQVHEAVWLDLHDFLALLQLAVRRLFRSLAAARTGPGQERRLTR